MLARTSDKPSQRVVRGVKASPEEHSPHARAARIFREPCQGSQLGLLLPRLPSPARGGGISTLGSPVKIRHGAAAVTLSIRASNEPLVLLGWEGQARMGREVGRPVCR